MDRREDDMAAQAWPGFVDILSSTVIMFVFFVMVIVVVLFLYTIKYTATVEQQASERIKDVVENVQIPENLQDLDEEKIKTLEEIKELQSQKEQVEKEVEALQNEVRQLSAGLSASGEQSTLVEERQIVILFDDNSITITDERIKELKAFLEQSGTVNAIEIKAGDNPRAVTQSSGRQLSLARMLNARNVALSSGFEPAQISVNYVDEEDINGNYNWIKVILK